MEEIAVVHRSFGAPLLLAVAHQKVAGTSKPLTAAHWIDPFATAKLRHRQPCFTDILVARKTSVRHD